MAIAIGVIFDIHHRDDIAQYQWGTGPLRDAQYRQYSTAEARATAFVNQMNTAGAELLILGGDSIDAHSSNFSGTDAQRKAAVEARLDELIVITDTFTGGDVLFAYGNHEKTVWTAAQAVDLTPADFWTKVDTGGNIGARANEWNGDGDGTLSYTYDKDGIRFVVLYIDMINGLASPGGVDQTTWLEGTALNSSLPTVVIVHYTLSPTSYAYGYPTAYASIRSSLENNGNVQLVIQGHYHRNGIDGWTPVYEWRNDILYYFCRGSVLGAADGISSATATISDSAYYLFEIQPDAYYGDGKMRCNVTVTAYEKGIGKSQDRFILM